jgi:hypothetical protein
MDAIELLQHQHRQAASLLTAISETHYHSEKVELFRELASLLVRHDQVERQLFYPACEKALGGSALLGEPMFEHGVVEFCLYEADQALSRPDFDSKLHALGELLLQHMDEEERDLLPVARQALGAERLASLGEELARAFEAGEADDYHQPLVDSLRQVWPVC